MFQYISIARPAACRLANGLEPRNFVKQKNLTVGREKIRKFQERKEKKRKESLPHLVVVDASHVVVLVISGLEQQERLIPLHLDPKLLLVADVAVGRLQQLQHGTHCRHKCSRITLASELSLSLPTILSIPFRLIQYGYDSRFFSLPQDYAHKGRK